MYCSIPFWRHVWLLFASIASALDIYVAVTGDDGNDGSVGSALASPAQAQVAVRELLSNGAIDDITVHVESGLYQLEEPLNLTAADSGRNGSTVTWLAEGSDVTISGGLRVSGWQLNETSGIYTAQIPPGTESRNLYVNGKAANYARSTLQRRFFDFDNETVSWNTSEYDWIMSTPGLERAELRGINSFTDRYAPIESVGNKSLVMRQHSWRNNVFGYDTIIAPNADFGFYIQNALALLDEGGEFFLDSNAGTIYYMPLDGEDMDTADTWLGVLEGLVFVQGTPDDPIHDITFRGFNFAHTTWLHPSRYGYVDQQTGAHICENITYPQFEATRPRWCQMPAAIRIAMADHITFEGGSYTQLGSGGIGIGNDATAYDYGPGLGAQNVTVRGCFFTQVMGNSVVVGGVRAEAHHPNNTRSTNSHIHVTENVFYNVSSLFSSTVPILVTYAQYSTFTNNEIYSVPYSAICHGYGWGSNDANGSAEYVERGLYDYQPRYQTPTTSKNNLIAYNLMHDYGRSHTDLGAVYTLAKSPDTLILENYAQDADWFGYYADEASNSYTTQSNVWMVRGNYYAPNQGCLDCGWNTANNSLIDNFGLWHQDYYGQPNHTGIFNNTFIRNYIVTGLDDVPSEAQRVAFRAGLPPSSRSSRTVFNPANPNARLDLHFDSTDTGTTITLNISNFDDAPLTDLSITANTSLTPESIPDTIPPNFYALAIYELPSSSSCALTPLTFAISSPSFSPIPQLTITGTPPGPPLPPYSTLPLNTSTTTPSNATYGHPCPNTYTIRTGGRGLHQSFDDLSSIWLHEAIGSTANASVRVRHIDAVTEGSFAGLVLKNQLQLNSNGTNNETGYAAVIVDVKGDVSFAYDSGYYRRLDTWFTEPGLVRWDEGATVMLRLGVQGVTISGFYSLDDGQSWVRIGERGFVMQSHWAFSDVGMFAGSGGGWREGTAVFEGFEVAGSGRNALEMREIDMRKREL
jgi:hypothetical protein